MPNYKNKGNYQRNIYVGNLLKWHAFIMVLQITNGKLN